MAYSQSPLKKGMNTGDMKIKKEKLPSLSLFYPAHNEAGNIEEAVAQALVILPRVTKTFEIIVVNDGSRDATYQIAKRLSKKYKPARVVTQKNKGYGGALKRGFATAKYEWIFFTDADLQFDLSELTKLVAKTKYYDLVIGYRKKRAEGMRREILAQALRLWSRVLLGFPKDIKDIDCAFKLINRRVISHAQPLFTDGAMISTELLLKAISGGFAYVQVGVRHYLRRTGEPSGNAWRVIFKAVLDTFVLQYYLVTQSSLARYTIRFWQVMILDRFSYLYTFFL